MIIRPTILARRVFAFAVFASLVFWRVAPAFACAVCATLDPTLTASGEEQPFRGRLRLLGDVRAGRVDAGPLSLDDRRVEAGVVWAPVRELEIGFAAPYLFRHVTEPGAAPFDRESIGDVEIRGQFLAYEARGAFGRRRFGLLATLKLPTAPLEYDPSSLPLPSTMQPGCGSIAPTLGAYFSASRAAWSTYASVSLFLPFSVRDGPHSSDSLRAAAHVQYQPTKQFAGRLGVFARLDSNGELAPAVDDPSSGGFIGYVSGDVVVSPLPDFVVTVGVFFPVIEALRGVHHESAISALTVAYDF